MTSRYPRGYINLSYPRGLYEPPSRLKSMSPKWKRDQKEFTVSVTYHENRGCQAYLPKPIMELIGNPNKVRFVVQGKKIEMRAAN